MIYGGGVVALALFLLWIFCVFDVISTDDSLTRNMPKVLWLLIVIILPAVGSVAWLALGRPQKVGYTPGSTTYRPPKAMPRGPEDSPEFIKGIADRTRELKRWEDDLKHREEELKKREEDG